MFKIKSYDCWTGQEILILNMFPVFFDFLSKQRKDYRFYTFRKKQKDLKIRMGDFCLVRKTNSAGEVTRGYMVGVVFSVIDIKFGDLDYKEKGKINKCYSDISCDEIFWKIGIERRL